MEKKQHPSYGMIQLSRSSTLGNSIENKQEKVDFQK